MPYEYLFEAFSTAIDIMHGQDVLWTRLPYSLIYSNVLAEMASHRFFMGNGERFSIAYFQCSQIMLATLVNRKFIPPPAQPCATGDLPIFSNTHEQVYALILCFCWQTECCDLRSIEPK